MNSRVTYALCTALLFVLFGCGEGKRGNEEEAQPAGPNTSTPPVTPQVNPETPNPGPTAPKVPKWSSLTVLGAPEARKLHTAVWTGSEMIIYGGIQYPPDDPEGRFSRKLFSGGGAYDPTTDSWRTIAAFDLAEPRSLHTAVWTGSEMIVWGGATGEQLRSGGRYSPTTNTWSLVSTDGSSVPRYHHESVWTGSKMFLFGGLHLDAGTLSHGYLYTPATDSWTQTTLTNEPSPRFGHSLTYIPQGGRIVVFGGFKEMDTSKGVRGDGAIYKISNNTWTPISSVGAPSPRAWHTAVWTGKRLIVWGGKGGNPGASLHELGNGAMYDPDNDRWEPMSSGGMVARFLHTAVWTGDYMVVWSGEAGNVEVGGGGIYDPKKDSWVTLPKADEPAARWDHTAVWTGAEMITFGGVRSAVEGLISERRDGGVLRWEKVSEKD